MFAKTLCTCVIKREGVSRHLEDSPSMSMRELTGIVVEYLPFRRRRRQSKATATKPANTTAPPIAIPDLAQVDNFLELGMGVVVVLEVAVVVVVVAKVEETDEEDATTAVVDGELESRHEVSLLDCETMRFETILG